MAILETNTHFMLNSPNEGNDMVSRNCIRHVLSGILEAPALVQSQVAGE